MNATGTALQADTLTTRDGADEPPPFLGSWKNVYLAVLLYLALLIEGLDLISRWLNLPLA